MKSSIHKWIRRGTACCIIGAALIFAGYLANGRAYVAHANLNSLKWSARNDDSSNIITLPKTKLDTYQALQVSLSNLNLAICPSENDTFYIAWEISSANGETPVSYELKDSTLTVTESPHTGHSYIHVDISFLTSLLSGKGISYPADTIYLYIPKQQLNQITVNNELGDLSITDSILDTCTIAMGDGDLKLTGNQYQNDITITNTLGNVTIKNPLDTLTDIGLHLATSLGEIHLPEALSATISGDITSYNQEGTGSTDLTITCKDGDIKFSN